MVVQRLYEYYNSVADEIEELQQDAFISINASDYHIGELLSRTLNITEKLANILGVIIHTDPAIGFKRVEEDDPSPGG